MAGLGQTSASVACPRCGSTIVLRFNLRSTGLHHAGDGVAVSVAVEVIGTPIEDHMAAEHWDDVVQGILLAGVE